MTNITWIVPAQSWIVRGCLYYTNNNQKKLLSPITWRFWSITTATTNIMLIIIIIIIISKIQFLLHIHKKDLFLLPTPTEVAFNTTKYPRFYSSSNPSQPNHSSLLRTTRCGILLNHRITAFQQHLASITEWMPSKANLCFLLSGSDPPIVELEFCPLGSQTGTLNPAALPKVTEVILLHQHAIIKLIKCHPGDILLPWTNAAH